MGLMDKVKTQASQLAGKAQEAGKVGQAKLEALQAKRKADALLGELGAIAFKDKAGRGAPGDERRIGELVEQLQHYEAEYGAIDAEPGVADEDTASSTSD